MDPIRPEDSGRAVQDVQNRLITLDFEVTADGFYGPRTSAAVRKFREREGLADKDFVDDAAWHALVNATFSLGDRVLYLHMPYFHGNDVRELQRILSVLGFAGGDADGIYGAHTEQAVREFQASTGLTEDGIAGAGTVDAIMRLRHAWEGKSITTAESQGYRGYARAAEVLEHMDICFYGLDEMGREIASRIANLARATTSSTHVVSADVLGGVPPKNMLRAGISTEGTPEEHGVPVLQFAHSEMFEKRLAAALGVIEDGSRRLIVAVLPAETAAADASEVSKGRLAQHIAVRLLDAFCSAWV